MAIDPDIQPHLDALTDRIVRVEARATQAEQDLAIIEPSIAQLEQTVAALEQTPGTPGGIKNPAIIVAAANSPQAIKARADVVCTGTGDAAAINRITEPVQLVDGCYQLEQPLLIQGRGDAPLGWSFATVLMKAQQFTNAGRGSTAALIKAADTVDGNRAAAIQIRDLFLAGRFRGNFGAGGASGTPVAGVWLEITGDDNNDPADGWPVGGPDASDNWSSLSRSAGVGHDNRGVRRVHGRCPRVRVLRHLHRPPTGRWRRAAHRCVGRSDRQGHRVVGWRCERYRHPVERRERGDGELQSVLLQPDRLGRHPRRQLESFRERV
jgi:hypothetical protein